MRQHTEQVDLVSDLLAPIPRTAIVSAVRAALGISHKLSDRVVQALVDTLRQRGVGEPAASVAAEAGRGLRPMRQLEGTSTSS